MLSAFSRFLVLLMLGHAVVAVLNRINHKGNSIFLNGINVAWADAAGGFCNDLNYLDADCLTDDCQQDRKYFESMFRDIAANGGNSIRLWLLGDGNILPVQNNDYSNRMVDTITERQIGSAKWVLELGGKYGVLVNLCVWSFDMVNDEGYGSRYGLWNKIVTNEEHTVSFLDKWLTPLVQAVKEYDSLLSIEVFNEPEGMMDQWGWTSCKSNTADCARITILEGQKFANRVASAIHDVSADIKVTVGSWSYMGSSNVNGHTNIWSDRALVAAGGKQNGVLDYFQVHYYNPMGYDYSPFLHDVDHWGNDDSKPHVIGEFPNNPIGVGSKYFYETLYGLNYAGAWGWCYNCRHEWEGQDFDREPFLDNMKYMQTSYGKAGWPEIPPQPTECTDAYPFTDGYSCAQQAAWGQCGQSFMASPVCDKSCGRCVTAAQSYPANVTAAVSPHPHIKSHAKRNID